MISNEPTIRLSFFFGILVLMALSEKIAPRRHPTTSSPLRQLNNLGIAVLNTILLRSIFPVAAVGSALLAAQQGWGLFNTIMMPGWLSILLSIVLLDLVIYWQHRLFHALSLCWQIHKVHHADPVFDVTTGLRFHPIEILLSMGIKITAIWLLGIPPLAVLIFEILLNATAMFNHSNMALPEPFDHFMRLFIVTPDMHRIHHSVIPAENNSNFGFNLTCWDRLFGTYRADPIAGQEQMLIGLPEYQQDQRVAKLLGMLILPFVVVTENQD
jgi:sterol desaturase/sphingolipid hydroxylase (fatty acid hydroxylase superfamily)